MKKLDEGQIDLSRYRQVNPGFIYLGDILKEPTMMDEAEFKKMEAEIST